MAEQDPEVARALNRIASALQWVGMTILVLASMTMCSGSFHR